MSRLIRLVSVLLLVALCVPAVAGAQEVSTFSFAGKGADAWTSTWSEQDPGAGSEDWFLWGGFTTGIQTGAMKPERYRENMGAFSYSSYVPTSATEPATYVVFSAYAPATLVVSKSLTAASLDFVTQGEIAVWRTEMPWDGGEETMLDPDETRTVGVSVTGDWTSAGPLWRNSFMQKSRTDGFFSIDRYSSTNRNAVCEALVVDSEGTVWFEGAFDQASISDSRGGGHVRGLYPQMP